MGQNTQPIRTIADLSNLGEKVTSRDLSWEAQVQRAWYGEYYAPDHNIYQFSNGRGFDSTDKTNEGIYGS